MRFMTTREFRRPTSWLEAPPETSVVTSHGKPILVALPVMGENLDDVLEMISRLEGLRALSQMQTTSRTHGLDSMSEIKIDAIIAAARKDRRSRTRRHSHRS
jgi:hypothetical protein